ncbi:MAG: L-serine ammonia-lyase, iron-sulfur-dependent, subunit alpha, partial [Alistipes sp.]
ILKNAMGVGIPGTGMIGLPIAIALGALIGRSEYQLEVLKESTPEAVESGRQFIDQKRIAISLKENITEKLYIEIEVEANGHRATAIISGGHTTFIYIAHDGKVLLDAAAGTTTEVSEEDVELNLHKVWDFATTAPLEELRFILETRRLNKAAAERAFEGDFGHCVGKTMRMPNEKRIMGDSVFSHILSYTSAACDARMAGAMIPVMSNSGSGNQGIAATLPVVVYAEENHATEEQTIRMGNDSARQTGYLGTGQNFVNDSTDATDVEFTAEMRRGSVLFAKIERLDFIKCDIEGYEVVVMNEIRPLLERFHPTVLIETGGVNRAQIIALFTALGYKGSTLHHGTEVALQSDSHKDIIFRYTKPCA